MRDGSDQLIDNAIGIAGAACGIGLSLKIVGWVAGVQDLDPVEYTGSCCLQQESPVGLRSLSRPAWNEAVTANRHADLV